jgi:hypothetical protein
MIVVLSFGGELLQESACGRGDPSTGLRVDLSLSKVERAKRVERGQP